MKEVDNTGETGLLRVRCDPNADSDTLSDLQGRNGTREAELEPEPEPTDDLVRDAEQIGGETQVDEVTLATAAEEEVAPQNPAASDHPGGQELIVNRKGRNAEDRNQTNAATNHQTNALALRYTYSRRRIKKKIKACNMKRARRTLSTSGSHSEVSITPISACVQPQEIVEETVQVEEADQEEVGNQDVQRVNEALEKEMDEFEAFMGMEKEKVTECRERAHRMKKAMIAKSSSE